MIIDDFGGMIIVINTIRATTRIVSLVASNLAISEDKAKGKRQEAKGLEDFFLTLNSAM